MREAFASFLGHKLPAPVEGALQRLLLIDRFESLYQEVRSDASAGSFVEHFLHRLQVKPKVSAGDLAMIPKTGPAVVVANHPFGLIEGAILLHVISSVRPDTKVLANHLLATIPEALPHCIFVDPFGTDRSTRFNQKGLKDTLAWLKQGRVLIVFPAGEVAHLNLRERAVVDPDWNVNVARIVRMTRAEVVPVFFVGANRAAFQLLGLLHPRLRTAMIAHEFLNKSKRTLELRIGASIGPEKLKIYQDDLALIRYLRHRTYLLQNRVASAAPKRVVHAVPQLVREELLSAEVSRLHADRTLVQNEEFQVLFGRMHELPNVVREIGRLRETTFRQVGEGSGKSVDLDSFDEYYWHMFLWSRRAGEIVGAYRLGPSEEILTRFGPKGFYTSRLFAWKTSFLDRIRPAVELGRSFVRPEYQRSFAPLLLLWKGIGQFLLRYPQYKILFGPVSISNDYSSTARQLMVKFLSAYCQSPDLAPLVEARNPFRQQNPKLADDLISSGATDLEEVSAMVADIEADRKGMPILLKHYLKLGGQLTAFNVDPQFSDALDGLIVVDLRKTNVRVLERYMGKEGAAAFLNTRTEPTPEL